MKSLTLILSVYKKLRELDLILAALNRQSHKEFDVIIADDGSGSEMEEFVSASSRRCNYKVTFLTQEDKGFRKNKILNESAINSKSEYLIFLDSDCIPHKDFVKAHYEYSEPGTVLVGRRVHLNKRLSDELTKEYVESDEFDNFNLRALGKSIGIKNTVSTAEEGIIIRNKFVRKTMEKRSLHIVGCNFSLPRELLLKINGFDENYIGAGIGEDSDIEYRLGLVNASFRSVRNLAVVFHMYHPKTKESRLNYHYFHNHVKLKKEYFCENGIVKLNNSRK